MMTSGLDTGQSDIVLSLKLKFPIPFILNPQSYKYIIGAVEETSPQMPQRVEETV